ncbi:MAG TPA: phage tail length tape measure family protein [Bacteroidales bacterium]|nr:phage tail length tape measure family protein [Bacteroidales bacterium]
MAARTKIAVELDLLNGEYLAKMKQSQAVAQGFASRLQSSMRSAAAPMLALTSSIGLARQAFNFLKNAIGYVIETVDKQNKAELQLEARLKSTGHAAGLTKDELLNMALALQDVTTYGDETVIEAENLLLTFTKIGKEVMPEALETVLNMSVALGQDMKSSAIQLGKALNDPILGVTALRRVGVQLSKDQEGQIRQYVKLGNVMSAQKIILSELATQMGGAARTEARSLTGQIEQMKNVWSDLVEELGRGGFSQSLIDIVQNLKTLGKWLKDAVIWADKLEKTLERFDAAVFGRIMGLPKLVKPIESDPFIQGLIEKLQEERRQKQLKQTKEFQKPSPLGKKPAVEMKAGGMEETNLLYQQLRKAADEAATAIGNSFTSAFSNIDQANRQLTYDLIWGEGGWKNWQKQMSEILKQFVADIIYATIKLIALRAVMTAVGFSTVGGGGAFAGGFTAGLLGFKRGYVPVLQGGQVPSGHVPAYIDPSEAVINKQSTRSYNNLLRAINENPGGGAGNTINISFNGNVMNDEYVDGYVIPKLQQVAKSMGATVFTRKGEY